MIYSSCFPFLYVSQITFIIKKPRKLLVLFEQAVWDRTEGARGMYREIQQLTGGNRGVQGVTGADSGRQGCVQGLTGIAGCAGNVYRGWQVVHREWQGNIGGGGRGRHYILIRKGFSEPVVLYVTCTCSLLTR